MSEKLPTTGPAYSFNTDKLGRPLYYSYDREDPKKAKTRLNEQALLESINIPVKTEREWYTQGFEDAQIEEKLETEGFPKSGSWSSLYNGDFQAKVLGKYKDGSYLIELNEEVNGSLQHKVPGGELVIVEDRTDEPEAPAASEESSDSPEVQSLKDRITELENVVASLQATIEDLRNRLAEARGEKADDKEKDDGLKVGQKVRAYSKWREGFDDDWTIQKIEDKDDIKTVWLTKPGSKNKLRGEPEELTLEVPYDRLLAWQNENSDNVENDSPAETEEDGDENFKPGQKVNVFSYKDRELQENWEVVRTYTDDEGIIQVEVKSPDGETESWPKDKLLAIQDLEYEKEPLPTGMWARLKERFNRARDRIRGERDAATTAVIVGGPNSTPEQQKRRRRLAFLAGALGGAAVAALICDAVHEGGLIDGTWLDDGNDKGLGSGGQGERASEGAGYGDITVNGGPGDDTFNIYPEGTEDGPNAGNSSDGDNGSEGNENGGGSNPPETLTTGETFKVEYGNGVTHEIQEYAQHNGVQISKEDAFRIYEQLEGSQHDRIIDLHGTPADSYWHVDPQSGPEVRIASPGTANWYPEAESQLRTALGLS